MSGHLRVKSQFKACPHGYEGGFIPSQTVILAQRESMRAGYRERGFAKSLFPGADRAV